MSWAANNPENWNEIERNGVARKIADEIKAHGWDDFDWETVRQVVKVLQEECDGPEWHKCAWGCLCAWANAEISEAEADYHTRGI